MQSSVARCGCAARQDSYLSNSATKESVSLSEEVDKAMAPAAHDRDIWRLPVAVRQHGDGAFVHSSMAVARPLRWGRWGSRHFAIGRHKLFLGTAPPAPIITLHKHHHGV